MLHSETLSQNNQPAQDFVCARQAFCQLKYFWVMCVCKHVHVQVLVSRSMNGETNRYVLSQSSPYSLRQAPTEPEAHCLGQPGRPVSSGDCLHSLAVGMRGLLCTDFYECWRFKLRSPCSCTLPNQATSSALGFDFLFVFLLVPSL